MMGGENLATNCLDRVNGVNRCQENRISKRKERKSVAYLLLNDWALTVNF